MPKKKSKRKLENILEKMKMSKQSACNAGDPGLIPGSERSPEEGNGTHSSIFAWRIPWTEEPGRLQSMGLQRVRHKNTMGCKKYRTKRKLIETDNYKKRRKISNNTSKG